MKSLLFALGFLLSSGFYAQSIIITHKGSLKNTSWLYDKSIEETATNTYETSYVYDKNIIEKSYRECLTKFDKETCLESRRSQIFISVMNRGGIHFNAKAYNLQNTNDFYAQHQLSNTAYETYWNKSQEKDNMYRYEFLIIIDKGKKIAVKGKAYITIPPGHRESLAGLEKKLFQHIRELQFNLNGVSQTQSGIRAGTPDKDDDNEGMGMIILIGALTGAVLAGLLRKKRKKKKNKSTISKKKNKNDEEAEYVLQINKENFVLDTQNPQILEAKVWKITKKGKQVVDAGFKIYCAEKALDIQPAQAQGILRSSLGLSAQPARNEFYIQLTAVANGHTAQKQLKITTGKKQLIVKTEPGKPEIRPNTGQTLKILAKVTDENGKNLDDLSQNIQFDATRSKWIDLSEPVWQDGWVAINLQTSDPDANAAVSHPPASVILGISVEYEENNNKRKLENNLEIKVLDCRLETNLEQVSFPVADTQTEVIFEAHIENCDSLKTWKFEADYRKDDGTIDNNPLTDIEMEPVKENKIQIRLTGPLIKPVNDEQFIQKNLVIKVRQKDEKPLERHINVRVAKEGLFIEDGVTKEQAVHFTADGKTEKSISLGLYVYDEKSNRIIVDEKGLQDLTFELLSSDQTAQNIDSVLNLQFIFDNLVTNVPHGRYKITSNEPIPGLGETYDLQYRIKSPVSAVNHQSFETYFHLKVQTLNDGKKHPTWDEAYRDCKYIINTYVPEGNPRIKLNALLEKRKVFLDAEGLVGLRQKIWKIASNLILAEGAEGYKDVEVWADRIVTTLEWTQWAGDIAFNALSSYYMARFGAAGGLGAVGLGWAKDGVIEGINFYIYEDQPVEVFFDRQYQKIVPLLMNVAKGHVLSIENIEHFVTKNKALAWTVFIACEYTYNLYQTQSMIEAAKETARQMRDELIIRKVTHHLHKNAMRYKIPATDVESVLKDIEKAVTGPKGHEEVKMQKVLEYMRDPAKVRTLKEHAPEWIKKAFDRTRNKIYKEHDRQLIEHLSQKYHLNPDDIRIDDFRTPGTEGYNLNTDRDYRVLRKVKTNSGQEVWIEVHRKRWIDFSYETFGKLTNKPSGIDAKEWAEYHQQRGTDRFDAEASMDYSDHFYDPETGEYVNVEPNINKAKRGESTLHDAKALGEMYKNKVMNSLEPGVIPEAYAQAKKGIKTLKDVRKGYEMMGKKLPPVSENLQKAMEIIKEVPVDARINPEKLAEVQRQLQSLGYDDIGKVADDLSKSFSDLSVYDNPVNLKPVFG